MAAAVMNAGDFILPYISTAKSPQQVMGSLVKYYFGAKINKTYSSSPLWNNNNE